MSRNIFFRRLKTPNRILFCNLIFKILKLYQIQHILSQNVIVLCTFSFCKEFNYQFFFKRWRKGIFTIQHLENIFYIYNMWSSLVLLPNSSGFLLFLECQKVLSPGSLLFVWGHATNSGQWVVRKSFYLRLCNLVFSFWHEGK